MDRVANEIQRATRELGFAAERFRRLSSDEAKHVYESALQHFVPRGRPRWWWEHFPASTGVRFEDGDGWRCLVELVPDADERAWFIAENSVAREKPVWDASVRDIQAVIGECFGFEYYIINKQHHWLICENHHDFVVAVGDEVEERLKKYDARNTNQRR